MVLLMTVAALVWNFVAVLIGVFTAKPVSVSSAFFAVLYVVIGIPGAWYTWCVAPVMSLHVLPCISHRTTGADACAALCTNSTCIVAGQLHRFGACQSSKGCCTTSLFMLKS